MEAERVMKLGEESRNGGEKKKRLGEDKDRHVEDGRDEEKRSRGRVCGQKINSYPLCGFHSTSVFKPG